MAYCLIILPCLFIILYCSFTIDLFHHLVTLWDWYALLCYYCVLLCHIVSYNDIIAFYWVYQHIVLLWHHNIYCDTTMLFCIVIVVLFFISVNSNFITLSFGSLMCPNVPLEWPKCVLTVTYYTVTVPYYDLPVPYLSILYTTLLSQCVNESSDWHIVSLQCHV